MFHKLGTMYLFLFLANCCVARLLDTLQWHYLSYTKIGQTKCYKQSDNIFQFNFHCSLRCCAPFCSLCSGHLLLIGGKLSTANQDPLNILKVQHREQNGVHHLKEQ